MGSQLLSSMGSACAHLLAQDVEDMYGVGGALALPADHRDPPAGLVSQPGGAPQLDSGLLDVPALTPERRARQAALGRQ